MKRLLIGIVLSITLGGAAYAASCCTGEPCCVEQMPCCDD